MYIKNIKIKNFRQLKDVEIDLNNEINILAGSNNSGKTSILELFNILFNNNEFLLDDLNNIARVEITKMIERLNNEGDEERENIKEQILSKKIEIEITIEYLDEDNISLIGEFINELIASNKFIYLKVESFLDLKSIDSTETLNLSTKYYYSDSKFEIKEEIDKKKFKEKFNYKKIEAKRNVNDTSDDKNNLLSKNLHDLLKDDYRWKNNIEQVKEKIKNIENEKGSSKFEDIFDELKGIVLKDLINDFENTNGGNIKELKGVLTLHDDDILNLLKKSILLNYDVDGVKLKESSQGLGYSNLLYMLMEIYKYEKNIENNKLNILFIEEPESHMHPAMERRLIKYFEAGDGANIQKVITSHSKEIIEFVRLENIKVLKKEESATVIYDLNKYISKNNEDSIFIRKFIRVISDIFYADKVIMFEGDGERLYLQHIINDIKQYEKLKNMYISFIQVGGRHASSYETLLKFLNLKVLILADMDYGDKTKLKSLHQIGNEKTTNPTIRKFIDKESVKDISKILLEEKYGNNLKVVCFAQSENDGYARSFEDALLYAIYKDTLGIDSVLTEIDKDEWNKFNENNENIFSMANTNSKKTNLLDRSMALKDSKTNFIYDFINSESKGVPDYVNRGLEWLMKE